MKKKYSYDEKDKKWVATLNGTFTYEEIKAILDQLAYSRDSKG